MRWTTLRQTFALAFLSILTVAALAISSEACAQSSAKVHFDIAAQPLNGALRQFALQSKRQVIFDPAAVPRKSAPAINGDLVPEEALKELLEGSGLIFTLGKGDTLVITPAAATSESGDTTTEYSAPSVGQSGATEFDKSRKDLDEIVVTGTHIRGTPASPTVVAISSQEIERSPFQSTGDLLRNLPQNFSGGQNINVNQAAGRDNAYSSSFASTANLRGLGSDSTLTLIDGHRLASADLFNAVDVSLIPLTAIERIDVDTDGASAIYGSDAVAGVVNFIMKKNYSGVDSWAQLGTATRGGGTLQQYGALAGHNWDDSNVLISYEFARQNAVNTDQRSFIDPNLDGTSLLPRTERSSFYASANHNFNSDVKVSFQGLYTLRSAIANTNYNVISPGETINVNSGVKQYGAFGDIEYKVSDTWRASISVDASEQSTNDPQFQYFGGPPAVVSPEALLNRMKSVEVTADGNLFALPAGEAKLALGSGYRYQTFDDVAPPNPDEHVVRRVAYAYAETALPLLSPMNANRSTLLELTGAVRYDHYSDFGSTTNPKATLAFRPLNDMAFQASWGKSFQAPNLAQEYAPNVVLLQPLPDPLAASGSSPVLVRAGGNSALQPQTSTSKTVGVSYKPGDFSTTINYFDINYANRIGLPIANLSTALSDPTILSYITRNPSPSVQAAALNNATFYNIIGPTQAYDPASIAALIDDRLTNATLERVRGVDALLDYKWTTHAVYFDASVDGTYLDLQEKLVPLAPNYTLSGTVFYPPKYKARASIDSKFSNFESAIYLNYVGKAVDPFQVPPAAIASWTTVDLNLGYEFPTASYGSGLRVNLTVTNLFDRAPPFVNASQSGLPGLNFDSTNASAVGRFVAIELRKRW